MAVNLTQFFRDNSAINPSLINLILEERVILANFINFIKVMFQFLKLEHAIVLLYLKLVGGFSKLKGLLSSFVNLSLSVVKYHLICGFAKLVSCSHLLVEKELLILYKVGVIFLKHRFSLR